MITQIYYTFNGQCKNIWVTSYSDSLYNGKTRKHLMTRTNPTARQVRHLHKQKTKWVKLCQ